MSGHLPFQIWPVRRRSGHVAVPPDIKPERGRGGNGFSDGAPGREVCGQPPMADIGRDG
ncbi:hypothetical protein GCM10009602_51530 [Nocardiopsis tropica]